MNQDRREVSNDEAEAMLARGQVPPLPPGDFLGIGFTTESPPCQSHYPRPIQQRIKKRREKNKSARRARKRNRRN
jgi:hypothetical protein